MWKNSAFLGMAFIFLINLISCMRLPEGHQKIDPVLLAQLKQKDKSAQSNAYYSCIIYTTNPESLRETGVRINSVFSTFITSRLSGSEVFKLAKMPQVTYIESPKPDHSQAKDGVVQKF